MADPDRFGAWFRRNLPSREQIAGHRFSRPFRSHLQRNELWRFTRRSVPRGVAAGLFVGVFALIPGVQIVGAALMSIPFRANIPVAAAMTFLTNPLTTPFLIAAAIPVGNQLGFHADSAAVMEKYARGAPVGEWLTWFFSDAAPALISGLFIIAVLSGAIGYFLSVFIWRWWTARKWRRRAQRNSAAVD